MTIEYDLNDFGERLKSIMQEQGLSQRKLCEMIHADGFSVRSWITGKHYPNGYFIVRLCKALDVSADYLLFGGEMR